MEVNFAAGNKVTFIVLKCETTLRCNPTNTVRTPDVKELVQLVTKG